VEESEAQSTEQGQLAEQNKLREEMIPKECVEAGCFSPNICFLGRLCSLADRGILYIDGELNIKSMKAGFEKSFSRHCNIDGGCVASLVELRIA
jgi:hypothetical protein